MPFLFCSSRSRSRTCAWMVTSSAVVGSSATSRSGPAASAMAIIARCFRPPESWNGYSPARRAASGTPTESSSERTRSSSCAPRKSVWRSSTSRICVPIVSTGLRLVAGSWKIIAMRRPRTVRIAVSGSASSSPPESSTVPETMRPVSGSRRMSESAVIVFPDPDSPTIAKVSPRRISKSTPSTARTAPPGESSTVLRFRTLSRVSLMRQPPPRRARAGRTRRAPRRRTDSPTAPART